MVNQNRREIIACDIDDVLRPFKDPVLDWYNETYDSALTSRLVPNYLDIHQVSGEEIDFIEAIQRIKRSHRDEATFNFVPRPDALEVLPKLARRSDLGFIAVTAAQKEFSLLTKKYISTHFPGIFQAIYHTELHPIDGSAPVYKHELCRKLGVRMLIDDSVDNCKRAASDGMLAILFGDHPWQAHVSPEPNLVALPDWFAVERFLTPPTLR